MTGRRDARRTTEQWDDRRTVEQRDDGRTAGRRDTAGGRRQHSSYAGCNTWDSGIRERERMVLLAKCRRRCIKEGEGSGEKASIYMITALTLALCTTPPATSCEPPLQQQRMDDSTPAILGATLGIRGCRESEWYCWLSIQDVTCRNKRGVGRK